MMKNIIRGIMVFSALAGALAWSAQTLSAQAPSTPVPSTPSTPSAQTASADAVSTPTADEIVSKNLTAIGGKEAISQVKSISMETSVQVMGNDAPSTTVIVDGVGARTETDFNGSKMVQCYNDKGGWSVNPMAGAADPTPMPEDEYNAGKEQIHVGGGLYDYSARGSKVELLGKDAGTYKLKLTTKENIETTYVLDASTYLIKSVLRKGKFQGQDVDITTNFSDYRKTDAGYLIPYSMDVDFGGQFQLSIALKKVELNKTVDPAIFVMPKAGM
ncbi:MAG TPA: hypothetical protein VG225_16650 [Terracidiphilus sp.]|nr:hypothetical protein [Terracidiphilus sp.]